MKATIRRSSLRGEITIPGSKSHMIRALYFAALGKGRSTIRRPVRSKDGLAAARLCNALGIQMDMSRDDYWIIDGGVLNGPEDIIDVANSGTSMYSGAALIAASCGGAVVTGDEQIRRRPVQPVLDALTQLGVNAFSVRGNGCAPFYVKGPIRGGRAVVEGLVSQYVSASILAGTLAENDTVIEVNGPNETPYIEMTMQWMRSCGVSMENSANYAHFTIPAGQTYQPFDRAVPADFSSAAFPLIGAAITDSDVVLKGLDTRDVQGDKVLIDVLREMGADIEVLNNGEDGIHVLGGKELRGITIDCSTTPDSVPILSVLGTVASGETRLVGIESSRVKETDRPVIMERELKKMGADIEFTGDAVVIRRCDLTGCDVESEGDHRIAMGLTIAGLVSSGVTTVNRMESATISYPGFDRSMQDMGAEISFSDE